MNNDVNKIASHLSDDYRINNCNLLHNYCDMVNNIRFPEIQKFFNENGSELTESIFLDLIESHELPFEQLYDSNGIYWKLYFEDANLDGDDNSYIDDVDGKVIQQQDDEVKDLDKNIESWLKIYPLDAVVKKLEAAAAAKPEEKNNIINKGKQVISKFIPTF